MTTSTSDASAAPAMTNGMVAMLRVLRPVGDHEHELLGVCHVQLLYGRCPAGRSDEEDLAALGGRQEGRDAARVIDQRIQGRRVDAQDLERAAQARMLTSPSSLAMRNVSSQGMAAVPATGRLLPGAPESKARPWSAAIRSARNASRAQYWSRMLTGRHRGGPGRQRRGRVELVGRAGEQDDRERV